MDKTTEKGNISDNTKDEEPHEIAQMKSTDQDDEKSVSTAPEDVHVRAMVPPNMHQVPLNTTQMSAGTLPPTLTDTSVITTIQMPQPSLPEPHKRSHYGDLDQPPAKKAKDSSANLAQPCQEMSTPQYVIHQPDQHEGATSKESLTLFETSSALPNQEASVTTGIPPGMVEQTQRAEAATKQPEYLKEKLSVEEKLSVDSEVSPRYIPKPVDTEVPTKVVVPSYDGNRGSIQEQTPQSGAEQDSNKLLPEGGCFLNTDIPTKSSLLNKPDQITNDAEGSFGGSLPYTAPTESTKHELVVKTKLELPAPQSVDEERSHLEKSEGPVKPSDKEQSKEGGIKPVKDVEGEYEPRRTRHTSEEVPGMSTRSLRSGRRSPAEPMSRGKEKDKEESPPATRGRGQKDREMTGDLDSDGSSRKRSTRSSGRGRH